MTPESQHPKIVSGIPGIFELQVGTEAKRILRVSDSSEPSMQVTTFMGTENHER